MSADNHQAIEMLLPWFVTGRLNRHETEQVEQHLVGCASCTEALVAERQMKKMIAAIEVPPVPATIPFSDVSRSPVGPRPAWGRFRRSVSDLARKPARLATLASAQVAVLLVAFQIGQIATPPPTEYRLLSSGEDSRGANLIVMFDDAMLVADLRAIIRKIDGTIVDGPTESDAYLVRVEASNIASAMEVLGRDPRVLLAQPIDAE